MNYFLKPKQTINFNIHKDIFSILFNSSANVESEAEKERAALGNFSITRDAHCYCAGDEEKIFEEASSDKYLTDHEKVSSENLIPMSQEPLITQEILLEQLPMESIIIRVV